MKKRLIATLWFGTCTATVILLSAFHTASLVVSDGPEKSDSPSIELKKEVLEILNTKCNVCHRKKNPFMVFNEKNVAKRAAKIYQMVFVKRKMPKGNEVKLTSTEYSTLEKWLFTQQIF